MMVARRVQSLFSLLRTAILLAMVTVPLGCGGAGEFGRQAESQTPEQLRGLAVSYDLAKLGEEKPPVLPSPVEPRVRPPSAKRTPVTVWWQTPDGIIHHEEIDVREGAVDPNRYAGSVWLEVTPVGSKPRRLTAAPASPGN